MGFGKIYKKAKKVYKGGKNFLEKNPMMANALKIGLGAAGLGGAVAIGSQVYKTAKKSGSAKKYMNQQLQQEIEKRTGEFQDQMQARSVELDA